MWCLSYPREVKDNNIQELVQKSVSIGKKIYLFQISLKITQQNEI